MKALILLMITLFGWTTQSQAEAVEPLRNFVAEEVMKASLALETDEKMATLPPDQAWQMRRLLLRVQAKAGFSIPPVLKLELIPEMELVWEKGI